MAILDEADYRILDILQKDGRITFSDLADQVNLSRSAVRERIKNMQDSGIIRGFTAIIVAWMAKFNTITMILITTLLVFLDRGAHRRKGL